MPKIPLMILGIVAVLLLALVAIMAITSAQPNPTQMGNKLLRQVTSTVEITTLAEKNLKSGELVSLNSTLKSQLTGASASLTASLTTAGIKLEKASTGSKAAALEGGQEVVDKLEEARLLSTYDRAYARELSYRLSLILAQLTTVHNNTNSAQLKKQLSTTYDNLKPLKDQLDSIGSKLE